MTVTRPIRFITSSGARLLSDFAQDITDMGFTTASAVATQISTALSTALAPYLLDANLDSEVTALGYLKEDGVFPLNHIVSWARFTSADSAGVYGLGQGIKAVSGAQPSEPLSAFPITVAAFPAGRIMKIGAIFMVNGITVPGTTAIDAGLYPVTIAGSGQVTYTLATSGAIVETYNGLAAGDIVGGGTPNRRSDIFAAGDKHYCLGVNLHTALPSNSVVDVALSLQINS